VTYDKKEGENKSTNQVLYAQRKDKNIHVLVSASHITDSVITRSINEAASVSSVLFPRLRTAYRQT